MLHFVRFQKSYGSHLALNIKDLTIDAGIYWVKGINGSGKSTLLQAIAGILYFNGRFFEIYFPSLSYIVKLQNLGLGENLELVY